MPYVGYLTLYLKMTLEDGQERGAKFECDFCHAPDDEFFESVRETIMAGSYSRAFKLNVVDTQYITKEEYEALVQAQPQHINLCLWR